MSRWFPDVSTAEGMKSARIGATAAAIVFGIMVALGVVFTALSGHLPGEATAESGAARIGALVGMGLEAAIAFAAAWRFHRRKGLVFGSITVLLFMFEILAKLASGHVGWIIVYVMILMGLINGLRAGWARREHGDLEDTHLEQVFE